MLQYHRLAAAVGALVLGSSGVALALDGSTARLIDPLNIAGNDWRVLELYTGSDNITSIADPGYTAKTNFDGIGAFKESANSVRVLFNHEITFSAPSTAASVSYLSLNKTNFRNWLFAGTTTPSAQVTTKIGTAWTSTSVVDTNFTKFCSSTLFEANRYGANRGFASRVYMNGEEQTTTGSMFALDSDPASPTYRTFYECTALPHGAWENVAEIDTGRTDKVGLLMFEDAGSDTTNGTAPLRLWIGNKRDVDGNGSMSFLEKNGLAEGTTYYWVPDVPGTSAPQRFTATDQTLAGHWSASSSGAMKFSKLEDGAVNPQSGTQAAFNCQDQGTFTVQLGLSFNADAGATLNTAASTGSIKFLLEENLDGGPAAGFNNQDNMAWSAANLMFTQEDGDNQQIWQIDPSSANLTRDALAIAQINQGLSNKPGESTGIVDVSTLFGYKAGSILLTSTQSTIANRNQMVVMVSPNAQLLAEPALLSSALPSGSSAGTITLAGSNGNYPPAQLDIVDAANGFVQINGLTNLANDHDVMLLLDVSFTGTGSMADLLTLLNARAAADGYTVSTTIPAWANGLLPPGWDLVIDFADPNAASPMYFSWDFSELDGVQVTRIAAVPEPTALCLLSLAPLMLRRKRRWSLQ